MLLLSRAWILEEKVTTFNWYQLFLLNVVEVLIRSKWKTSKVIFSVMKSSRWLLSSSCKSYCKNSIVSFFVRAVLESRPCPSRNFNSNLQIKVYTNFSRGWVLRYPQLVFSNIAFVCIFQNLQKCCHLLLLVWSLLYSKFCVWVLHFIVYILIFWKTFPKH